jgi:uncharacterized cupredoxin-like copper-binding protein
MILQARSPILLTLTAFMVLPVAVSMAACSGLRHATSRFGLAQTSATTVTIHATDFAFQVDRTSIPAGPVHFVFINDSRYFLHEVMVYPQEQPKLTELLALEASGKDVPQEDYLQGMVGKVEDVPPGQTASFDATVQHGTYELGCFVTSTIGPGQMMVPYPSGGGANGYPLGPGMMGPSPGGGGASSYEVGMRVNHYTVGMHTLLTVTAP